MLLRKYQPLKIGLILVLAALLLLVPLGGVLAAGQPNQSCQKSLVTPGNSATAYGSAFNTSGVSQSVYAGTQTQNEINSYTVSQYDAACYQLASH